MQREDLDVSAINWREQATTVRGAPDLSATGLEDKED